MNKILLLAEHDVHGLKASTLATLTAAKQLNGNITLLLVGANSANASLAATNLDGISAVWVNSQPCYDHGSAEHIAALLVELMVDFNYCVAPASSFGKNILPRAAALLNIAMVSDVSAILDERTFKRPIYAGNALKTLIDHQTTKVLSIRASAFERASLQAAAAAPIVTLTQSMQTQASVFIDQQLTVSERPELTSARVIVSGGRALQSKENFDALLNPLAQKLNAAIGASRAAVDAGFAPNDYQVGQTGKIVAPELYIAIGISGAIQHVAGIKDSKVIVAINKDADATIFQNADYGLVGDLYQIIPELLAKL